MMTMEGGKTRYYFTVNALSHCDWGDCPERLVEEALGKTVLLVAEDDNVDPHAVRVHFGGKVAGYVCRDDAPTVRALVTGEGRQSRLALVTGRILEPYFKLRASCECADTTALTIDDHLNQLYDAWVYTGPLLPPSQGQKLLEGAVEYLSYVVSGQLVWDAESGSYFETFLRLHRQDYSDEMFSFRHQLMKLFESDGCFGKERRQLELELHEMSKHEHREGILSYITSLPGSQEFMQMMVRQGNVDVNTLLAQMAGFPENLTGLLLKDAKSFVKRLYYIHPRRCVLRRFFSGIATLMFLKQNGLLQNLPDQPTALGAANWPTAQPLQGLDRLANQLNVVLGQNPTTSY